jgi:hypothetical protein
MIHPKDLRIGNYISVDTVIYPVKGISTELITLDTGNYVCREFYVDPIYTSTNISQLHPVMIAPVILERCGFKNDINLSSPPLSSWYLYVGENSYLCAGTKGKGVYLATTVNDYTIDLPPTNPVEYLHQLQNLFYLLTGKELEIKL